MSPHDPPSKKASDRSDDLSLLEEVLGATRDAARVEEPGVVAKIVDEAMRGTVTRSKDLTLAIQAAIEAVELAVSDQLVRILHHLCFQSLEASWRGLDELVRRSETDASLKIKVLTISKDELTVDLGLDGGPSASRLYQKMASQLDDEGDDPYDVLVVDHELSSNPDDVEALQHLASVALSTSTLLIAPGSSTLCGLPRWSDLDDEFVLGSGLSSEQIQKWENFRSSEAGQAVILPIPRILSRRPYGAETSVVEEFAFEETGRSPDSGQPVESEVLCWMNPAFIVGALVNEAYTRGGREGVNEMFETGGRIGNLASFLSKDEDGDPVVNGPVEAYFDRHRDAALRDLGFTPMQSIRDGESVVINGFRTVFRPESG